MFKTFFLLSVALVLLNFPTAEPKACSTFKFQQGGELIYGHNLDQPGMDTPGMIFVNKRGVFKTGRSFSEMFLDKARREAADFCWISRYGSVTFCIHGRDFPDGGINEVGIFIWEMTLLGSQFPESPELRRILKMNWMQFVLDNSGTLDEALAAAYDFQIEGWHWHFFIGDNQGNCATVEFLDGQVVIHRGDDLPFPALFNESYDREMEYLQLFKGFGGLYEPDFNASPDTRVPRFVKAAIMLRDFNPSSMDALEYSKSFLYEVGNKPYKWGVLIDVIRGQIYFNTELNQEWKSFSYRDFDFSNDTPVLMLNIDQEKGGDVLALFHPMRDDESGAVFKGFVYALPDRAFEYYGIARETLIERFTSAYHEAERKERQYFRGVWKGQVRDDDENGNKEQLTLELKVDGSNVSGMIDYKGETCRLQDIRLVGNELEFSFRNEDGSVFFPKGCLNGESLSLQVRWIKGPVADFILQRQ